MPDHVLAERRNIELSNEIGEDNRQRIQVFPWGDIEAADGRGPWRFTEASAASIIALHEEGRITFDTDYLEESSAAGLQSGAFTKGNLFIDWDHQSQRGGPSEAAGWIENLEAVAPQQAASPELAGLWATVLWTPKAAEQIRTRVYRRFSGTFYLAENLTDIAALTGGGLTNQPAITANLPVAADKKEQKEGAMPDDWKESAAVLGIEAKTKDEFLAAAANLRTQAETAATTEEKLAAEKARADAAALQLAEAQATKMVDEAISKGKSPKEIRASSIARATKDPKGFAEDMALIPEGTIATNLPPQGKQGRDVAGGEAAEQAAAAEHHGRVVVHNVGPRNKVREGTLELTERVLAETKAKVNTPEFRQEAMAALRRRTAGGA